jgi:hypothetical protein
MKLFIVLQIKLLKLRTEIFFCFLALLCAVSIPAQTADSLRLNYNYINSVPQNAFIFINNGFIGNTPLYFFWSDSTYPKQVKISSKGYADIIELVDSSAVINKTFTLIPLNGTHKLNLVSEEKQLYFEKPRKIIPIIGSALISLGAGASAYHFKSLAIDNRDNYEVTGDPEALDKKKKYDLLSGISIVVFQAGLGALIYFLLID